MTVKREVYKLRVKPGRNAAPAAARMAKYIVDRWMPSHGGGVHVLITPKLAQSLLPFFQRDRETVVEVDTRGNQPELREVG